MHFVLRFIVRAVSRDNHIYLKLAHVCLQFAIEISVKSVMALKCENKTSLLVKYRPENMRQMVILLVCFYFLSYIHSQFIDK